jgi:hypothetical protein
MEGILYDDSAWERWLFQLLVRLGLRTSFYRFRAVWRHDYYGSVATTGEAEPSLALRRFLSAIGLSAGTVHEVCAAAICRQQRDIDGPVLIPSAATYVRKIASTGVSLTAAHQGNRSSRQWQITLNRWRLTSQFDRILAWPDGEHDGDQTYNAETAVTSVPAEIRAIAAMGDAQNVWYISCDRPRRQVACANGLYVIAHGTGDERFEDEKTTPFVESLADLLSLVTSARSSQRQAA